jgi:hypothetical protein
MVMRAVAGFMPKVMGIRIATPVAGPKPGSMPIMVPNVPPMKTQRILLNVNAV